MRVVDGRAADAVGDERCVVGERCDGWGAAAEAVWAATSAAPGGEATVWTMFGCVWETGCGPNSPARLGRVTFGREVGAAGGVPMPL